MLAVINPELDRLARAPYVSVTSYEPDGTAVATPLSIAAEGGYLLAVTEAGSGKVDRLRHDGRVLLAPCNGRGEVRGDPVPGVATVVDDAQLVQRAQRVLKAKYGLLSKALEVRDRFKPRTYVALAFEVSEPGDES